MTEPRPLPSQGDRDAIREGVRAVVTRFDDEYWLARDEDGAFPSEFHQAMAQAGWLGITMPQAYGGAGLLVSPAASLVREVARPRGGVAAAVPGPNHTLGSPPI